MLKVTTYRGTLSIEGNELIEISKRFLTHVPTTAIKSLLKRQNFQIQDVELTDEILANLGLHITTFTATEVKTILENENLSLESLEHLCNKELNKGKILPFGLVNIKAKNNSSTNDEGWYVLMHCLWADKLRSLYGLTPKYFHITLGFHGKDLHCETSYDLKNIVASREVLVCWNEKLADLIDLVDTCIEFLQDHLKTGKNECEETIVLRKVEQVLFVTVEHLCKFLDAHSECISVIKRAAQCGIAALNISQDPEKGNYISMITDIGEALVSLGIPFGLKLLVIATVSSQSKYTTDYIDFSSIQTMLPRPLHSSVKPSGGALIRYVNNTLMSKSREFSAQNALSPKVRSVFAITHSSSGSKANVISSDLTVAKLPRNFSWVTLKSIGEPTILDRYLLAGSAYPTEAMQMAALHAVGIRLIITVHESSIEDSLQSLALERYGITCYHCDVVDRTPPTIQQMEKIFATMLTFLRNPEGKQGVLVHCQGGVGRTNTIIIAYLIRTEQLSAAEAIAIVTAQRKIILSQSQQQFLRRWWQHCNTNNLFTDITEVECQVSDECVTSNPIWCSTTTYSKMASVTSFPPLIILCGLAAAGKSTFSSALAKAYPENIVRISKDEMRGKGQCENVLYDALRKFRGGSHQGTIIIDCCNLTAAKRKEWHALAHNMRAWCVFFDIEYEFCVERIKKRENHPTIPPGQGGVRILQSMRKQLEAPVEKERFERVITVENTEDAEALLANWGVTRSGDPVNVKKDDLLSNTDCEEFDTLLKFPRTPHIMNLGAATRDDKILTESDLRVIIGSNNKVIVEEKLDGANMGIFIRKSDCKIVAQNRSHFVSSKYHPQFAPLDSWISKHTQDLWQIIEPGRHILYGEWLYATHSVAYNKLPGWFVAYDLYDRLTKTFVSRNQLSAALQGTSIPIVPLLYEGQLSSIDQLTDMLKGPSMFNDTKREGVVVRLFSTSDSSKQEDNEQLFMRAKLVRADFIAGNDRWNKSSKLITNSLAI